jgi:hypothetical protein
VRVCVLTTSYPRTPGEPAGSFVADAVAHLRHAGVEVDVVSPADFRHFGIAYGDGIVQNLRAAPWRVLLLPLFLVSFALALARRGRRTLSTLTGFPRRFPRSRLASPSCFRSGVPMSSLRRGCRAS